MLFDNITWYELQQKIKLYIQLEIYLKIIFISKLYI